VSTRLLIFTGVDAMYGIIVFLAKSLFFIVIGLVWFALSTYVLILGFAFESFLLILVGIIMISAEIATIYDQMGIQIR